MKDFTFDGKTYAVNLKNTAIMDVMVMYYDRRVIEDNDYEDPWELYKAGKWTWDVFFAMCDQFVKDFKGTDNYGATFNRMNFYSLANGVDFMKYDSNSGKWVNTMNDPVLLSTWTTTADMIGKRWLAPDVNQESLFLSGKILFMVSGPFGARNKQVVYQSLKDRKRLGVVPTPCDAKGEYQVVAEYTAWGIPQDAQNAEAVPYFLRYMLDPSSYGADTIYYDTQAKEAVTAAMARTKRFPSNTDMITEDGGLNYAGLVYTMQRTKSAQMSTALAANFGRVQDAANMANAQVGLLAD